LLGLVERWLAADTCRRFVCTLKFQGPTDHDTARRFAAIPGSRLLHLHNNKHELTWMRLG
jgi:23S rRNA (cytidine2498-2'-O)-methyltransferase